MLKRGDELFPLFLDSMRFSITAAMRIRCSSTVFPGSLTTGSGLEDELVLQQLPATAAFHLRPLTINSVNGLNMDGRHLTSFNSPSSSSPRALCETLQQAGTFSWRCQPHISEGIPGGRLDLRDLANRKPSHLYPDESADPSGMRSGSCSARRKVASFTS